MKNGIEKNNQKSLEPIEKMNFVSLLETGNMQKIGQISIAVSSKGTQICGLGKDIYIVASSRYLQAFQYRDGVFSLGESVDTGVNGVYGDTLTSITPEQNIYGMPNEIYCAIKNEAVDEIKREVRKNVD
ncbi:hypothetical protein [Emergencia sp. 1XD21-10]|uniref:hypothetical protein n=1 Tax=Emergencia sp. 1XD21-10 TaxID=2304569 RepID=UPI0013793D97|nr:hypothetical protein [Emergencia sp. 1XD21-10]NCE98392.1 hypothetical protein [Emergencia sp. 1XD21-10]